MEMEIEGQAQQRLVSQSRTSSPTPRPPNSNINRRDFVLQWGNRKRLRCVKQAHNSRFFNPVKTTPSDTAVAHPSTRPPYRDMDSPLKKQMASSSPEKEDDKYYYSTRGSAGGIIDEDYNKFMVMEGGGGGGSGREREEKTNGGSHVWPKLFVSLSSKEKEEDFMAMKGCKLPQRPKKRAKLVQRSLLLVSPGAWLSDLCQERYEVREKKASKRRPRGLKAMGSMESDSD